MGVGVVIRRIKDGVSGVELGWLLGELEMGSLLGAVEMGSGYQMVWASGLY